MGIDKSSNRNPKQGRKKQSEYGFQLNEKQKVKFIYGVLAVSYTHLDLYKRQTVNKVEIKKAVEEAFGVKVAKVNTMNVLGKVCLLYTSRCV